MKRLWLAPLPILTLAVSWTLVAGCATEATPEDEQDSALPPEVDSSTADANKVDAKPPTQDANVRDTSTPDANKPDSTTTDSSTDAAADVDSGIGNLPGEPFDPNAPKTGAACPAGVAEFDVITRRCGACGSQKAFCEAGRIVGAYGACSGEKTGADICLPGAREVGVECGLCGSQVRNCDGTCVWSSALCTGEVVGGCPKGQVTYVEGVCTNVNQVRKQTCSQTCTRQAPEACADLPPDDILTAAQTAGGVVSGTFTLSPLTRTIPRLNSGSCPATSSSTSVTYHYARIDNPGTDSVNVTIATGTPAGSTKIDAMVSAYAGKTVPAYAGARQACTGSVKDTPETATLNIPAGGSVVFLTTAYASGKTGPIKLDVTTNFVGPEVPPPVDIDLTLDPVVNNSVSSPVNFVSTQITERLITGSCPTTLSSTAPSYRYIRVNNATAAAHAVDLSLATGLDTVIGVYPGPTPPLSGDRLACTGKVDDFCSDGVSGANSCLANVNVPAMGSIIVYAAPYSATSGTTTFKATTKN